MDRVEYQSLIVQDLLNLHNSEELDIAPWYQRRSVWNPNQQAYLVNSLLENKPIPALYIRHHLDVEKHKSIKEVVDGQQRARAILGYCADEFSAYHSERRKKVKFSELSKEQQRKYLMTSLPIGYLLGATDSDVIEIFGRINSVSKSLNAQEKRNAQFSGEFKQYCLREAAKRTPFWRQCGIFSGSEISRMLEVQFISDLVVNLLQGLSDYSAPKINKLYEEYDDEFPKMREIEDRIERVFSLLFQVKETAISDTLFRRQPIFFSLFLVLDANTKISVRALEGKLLELDRRLGGYELSNEANADDQAFIRASLSTTQRISQRKVRDKYLREHLA
jgi:hypothetical protein